MAHRDKVCRGFSPPGGPRVTDAALTNLDRQDLLAGAAPPARTILNADSAQILLLWTITGELIATAADGLEERVHQGFRVPRSAEDSPRRHHISVRTNDCWIRFDHDEDRPPDVAWPKGFRALLGAPHHRHDSPVISVLHHGSLTTRTFTARMPELLEDEQRPRPASSSPAP